MDFLFVQERMNCMNTETYFRNLVHRGSDSSLDNISLQSRERSGSGLLTQRSQSVGSINIHDSTVDLDIDLESKQGALFVYRALLTKSAFTKLWTPDCNYCKCESQCQEQHLGMVTLSCSNSTCSQKHHLHFSVQSPTAQNTWNLTDKLAWL